MVNQVLFFSGGGRDGRRYCGAGEPGSFHNGGEGGRFDDVALINNAFHTTEAKFAKRKSEVGFVLFVYTETCHREHWDTRERQHTGRGAVSLGIELKNYIHVEDKSVHNSQYCGLVRPI